MSLHSSVPFEREIRLVITLLLCAGNVFYAWRWSRRRGNDIAQAGIDALLIFFLTQYLSVGLPGLFGFLNAWSIGIVTVGFTGALACLSTRKYPAIQVEQCDQPFPRVLVFAIAG